MLKCFCHARCAGNRAVVTRFSGLTRKIEQSLGIEVTGWLTIDRNQAPFFVDSLPACIERWVVLDGFDALANRCPAFETRQVANAVVDDSCLVETRGRNLAEMFEVRLSFCVVRVTPECSQESSEVLIARKVIIRLLLLPVS